MTHAILMKEMDIMEMVDGDGTVLNIPLARGFPSMRCAFPKITRPCPLRQPVARLGRGFRTVAVERGAKHVAFAIDSVI